MMKVDPAAEPSWFHGEIRLKGNDILSELTGAPFRPHNGRTRAVVASAIKDIPAKVLEKPQNAIWRRAIPELRLLYKDTCAYLGVRIYGDATVDHFKPISKYQMQAYDWSNFRLSSSLINTFKQDHEDVLDPFLVQPGWFELTLLTGVIEPGKQVSDPAIIDQIRDTIKRLRLNENKTWVDRRREAFDRYIAFHEPNYPSNYPKWNLATLAIEFPFVASEIVRQGKVYQ
jgi:hypothetical protein